MPHLHRTTGGHLVRTTGGHLAKCTPLCADPSMLITITGAAGAINWCGKVWNLPGDSGIQYEVCPSSYLKGYYRSTVGTEIHINARQVWKKAGPWDVLSLTRTYDYTKYTVPATTRFLGNNRLAVKDSTDWRAFTGGGTFTFATELNKITAVIGPTMANYLVTNEFFGSTVIGGITYAWEKGEDWPQKTEGEYV